MSAFDICPELLDDYAIQHLPGPVFAELFWAAADGEKNLFSRYVRLARFRVRPDKWKQVKREVFERDKNTCQYCGTRGETLECDHRIPLSRGGSDDIDNLTTACRTCNRRKGTRTPEEFRVSLYE